MIAYANSKGITVWVHGWWSRENLNKTAGEEKIKDGGVTSYIVWQLIM
jgi:hypothetical protein